MMLMQLRMTYRVASVKAILIVALYPASKSRKSSMLSPIYVSLAQSRKLVRLLFDRDTHWSTSCWNSLQTLPHRNSGRSRTERSTSEFDLIRSTRGASTALKASSSPRRSRTALDANGSCSQSHKVRRCFEMRTSPEQGFRRLARSVRPWLCLCNDEEKNIVWALPEFRGDIYISRRASTGVKC